MKKLTQLEFITKANEKHNSKYTYSKVVYVNTSKKVDISCSEHGTFKQTPADHLYGGYGCSSCKFIKIAKERTIKAANSFTQKAINAHKKFNVVYDYSKVDYVNAKTPVDILCKMHGIFIVTPNKHLSGWGCAQCSHNRKKLTTKEFIAKAKKVHGNRFVYCGTQYQDYYTEIQIGCKKHGTFFQSPERHLHTKGCPMCYYSCSIGERDIMELLKRNNIEFKKEKTFPGLFTKDVASKPRYDFWLPKNNILIEYDGEQHFKPIRFVGCKTVNEAKIRFKRLKQNDRRKNIFAKHQGITLIRIPYTIKGVKEIKEFIQPFFLQALI